MQLPSPAAITNRNADSISTTVCRTAPPAKCSLVPRARLWNAAAAAHRYSESSRVSPSDAPIARPSLDKMTALVMFATRATRSSRSQSSCPGWRMLSPPHNWPGDRRGWSLAVLVGSVVLGGCRVRAGLGRRPGRRGPAALPPPLHRRHRGPYRLGRGRRGLEGPAVGEFPVTELRRQARVADPHGQSAVLLVRRRGGRGRRRSAPKPGTSSVALRIDCPAWIDS